VTSTNRAAGPLTPSVAVIDSTADSGAGVLPGGVSVRPTLGTVTGFEALQQALVRCDPGASGTVSAEAEEHTLFCLSGRGSIEVDGAVHALEPDVGLTLAPGAHGALRNDGTEELRLVSVRVPDPEPGGSGSGDPAAVVSRLSDREIESATTDREFRIVADPDSGLQSATHFVGYIPTVRAPEHFHTYNEVIYVIEGEGVMSAGEFSRPVFPGACIQLPARTVHCLENTGEDPMRIVAVFRPAGSPAAAFYPDGTPAYQGTDPAPTPEEE
jgi:mannose-6-phosphate isomerase-like protein (cupin superfamily)